MTNKEELYLKAKSAYYNGNPILSDFEFDELENDLKKINSKVVEIVGVEKGSYSIPHLSPMLSLEKIQVHETFPTSEFEKWFKDFPIFDEFESVYKFDGSSANLIYSNGCLISGATRGSKTIGADITSKVKKLVPSSISLKYTLEIRGEIVMCKRVFEEIYSSDYKNPRNLVAGLLGRDDDKGIEHINFVAFEVRIHKNSEWIPLENSFEFLKENGFEIPSKIIYFKNDVKEFQKVFESFKDELLKQPYEMDGIVIKTKSLNSIQSLGETSHHPNWALAVKFPPTRKSTEILNINWFMGITRRFTPVAELNPIELAGTTVSNVTLNNYSNVVNNGLGIGAKVSVFKSGEIIPKVDEIFEKSNNFNIPTNCPHCNSILIEDDNKTHIICPNENCEGLIPLKMLSSLRTLGCKNIGESLIERIVLSGFKDFTEVLDKSKFNEEFLIKQGQFKKGRELEKMIQEISKIKEISMEQIIMCCNLSEVGNTMSLKLSKFYNGEEVDFSGLTKIVVQSCIDGENRIVIDETIEKIKNLGLYKEPKKKNANVLKIEMTGSPKEFGYSTKEDFLKELSKFIEVENVSLKEAKYLVTDDKNSNSSKMKDAKKKGIGILLYDEIINRFKK